MPVSVLLSVQTHKKFLWLGGFGGFCPKPTTLLSNNKMILDMEAPPKPKHHADKPTTTRYVDKNGMKRCTGTKHLKESQWDS